MYALLLPALIYFAVFKYIPMAGIMIAFKNYNLALGLWDSPWVGFKNFTDFMNGVYFWDIMKNTIVISLYKLLFGFSAPIVLALLLNEVYSQWFKKIVQTITYLPHFLSWVIVYGIMVALLAPGDGLFNMILKDLGVEPISFLTEPAWGRMLIILSEVWKDIGWGRFCTLPPWQESIQACMKRLEWMVHPNGDSSGISRYLVFEESLF